MSDLNLILNEVLNLASDVDDLYNNIIIGNTPPTNGVSMFISSGQPILTDLEKGMIVSLHIMINSKNASQEAAFDVLSNIHKKLTKTIFYPNEDIFQITNISTIAYPNLLMREQNGDYVFGSTINVEFYWR